MADEKPRELQIRTAPQAPYAIYPHELHERLPDFKTLAEMKVVLYVFWHTYHWQEYSAFKSITLDEFEHGKKRRDGSRIDQGVGMAHKTIIQGIRQAKEDHLLYEQEDTADLARIEKRYALALWKTDEPEVTRSNPQGTGDNYTDEPEVTTRNSSSYNMTPPEVTGRNPRGNEMPPRSEEESLGRRENNTSFVRAPGAAKMVISQESQEQTITLLPSQPLPSLVPSAPEQETGPNSAIDAFPLLATASLPSLWQSVLARLARDLSRGEYQRFVGTRIDSLTGNVLLVPVSPPDRASYLTRLYRDRVSAVAADVAGCHLEVCFVPKS